MAVYWKWNNKIGYRYETIGNKTYRSNIYIGTNCLLVFNFEWTEEGTERYQFSGYVNDLDELKIYLGLKKDYQGKKENHYIETKKIEFFNHFENDCIKNKDIYKIGGLFAQAGISVIYNIEEEKEK